MIYTVQLYLGRVRSSTVLATTNTGVFQERQGYYGYGKYRTGGVLPTDNRYTGQKLDAATGLYYYGARYYDRNIGMFVSPDTLVPDPTNVWDYNRYLYARGNPLKYNDPTGHTVGPAVHDSNDGVMPQWLQELTDSWLQLWDNDPSLVGPTMRDYMKEAGGYQQVEATYELLALYQGSTNAGIVTEYQNTFANAWAGGELQQAWGLTGSWNANSAAAYAAATIITAAGIGPENDNIRPGSFSIVDWRGYPSDLPKPSGPFTILEGAEYGQARRAANTANARLRQDLGLVGAEVDIHEIHPVKLGGSPTDLANKVIVDRNFHQTQVTPWWQRIIEYVTGK